MASWRRRWMQIPLLMAGVSTAMLGPVVGILAAATVSNWLLSPVLVIAGFGVLWATFAVWDVVDTPHAYWR